MLLNYALDLCQHLSINPLSSLQIHVGISYPCHAAEIVMCKLRKPHDRLLFRLCYIVIRVFRSDVCIYF